MCIAPSVFVADPTIASGVPRTEAPNEHEDEEEELGGNPFPKAATCTVGTSPVLAGSDTHWAPLASVIASSMAIAATL